LLLVVLSRGYQLVHDERHTAGLCLAGQDMTVSICVVCVACDCVEEVCACVGGGGGQSPIRNGASRNAAVHNIVRGRARILEGKRFPHKGHANARRWCRTLRTRRERGICELIGRHRLNENQRNDTMTVETRVARAHTQHTHTHTQTHTHTHAHKQTNTHTHTHTHKHTHTHMHTHTHTHTHRNSSEGSAPAQAPCQRGYR
jgi:hypothetical protein